MDVIKALRELYLEKSRLDSLIAICESKIKEQDRRLSRSKRGRKSMSMEERKIVSERMRNYWASRRDNNSSAETGDQVAVQSSANDSVAVDQSVGAATGS